MNKQSIIFLQVSLVSLDILILNLIFFSFRLFFDPRIPDVYITDYFEYWLLISGVWLSISFLNGVYTKNSILSFEEFSRKTIKVYLFWFACVIAYLFFVREVNLSRLFIGSTIFAFGIGLLLNRFIYVGIKQQIIRRFSEGRHILIIGYNETSKKLVSYLEKENSDTEILGFTENEKNIKELSHYPIMGDIDSSVEISKKFNVDKIFSTITPEQEPKLYKIMQEAEDECIRFKIVPDLSLFVKGRFHVSYYNDIPILTTRGESLDQFNNRLKKRILDILISSFVLIFILSWLVPLISLIIYLESPGPIFFSQLRTGRNRKKFKCYKFRSMYVNEFSELQQASKDDKRITKVGKFLRRTSLDEFPQFINVLIGNMSVVGPRPHMLKHTNDYSKMVNQFMVRHFLKPGITGWAQVNGYRGEIKEPSHIKNRVEYDIWYMENWSLILDFKIIFLTIFNVLKGEEKAY
jgi:putative colanic acid biosysnthesis UDP-glucose lipid carrier transferase